MGLTFGPHPFSLVRITTLVSTYYDSASYLRKETPIFRILYEHRITRLFSFSFFLLFFFLFFFYSVALVRLLQNSLSTEVGGVAAAAEALPIRDEAEKNVGCMPVGLCHFRRGLS